ncbi:hypothetical protein BGZ46_000289 [Entomortierella lignicola]|nr:hypothetical protein BGZ46_000289 [Entomortierella lignicola]
MTDSAIYQQSKRLAGMSITDSSGNKVSILNDNRLDFDKATIKGEYDNRPTPPHSTGSGNGYPSEHGLPPLHSPRSPHFRSERHGRNDYFGEERNRDPYQKPSPPSSSSSSHRYRSESHEAGRSTSLTNAATPFRSGFDTRASDAASNSQRSRSLSSGAQLYPYSHNHGGSSPGGMYSPQPPQLPSHVQSGTSPVPFFMRAFSEDNTSEEHEAYRGLIGHSGLPEGLLTGPSFPKRKYSCTYPGCNKRFTTSGHLARHNRIHTGERNFPCLMPGCPSKFSRQDNMMQHYRTHISPKSRRGASRKQDQQDENATTPTTTTAATMENTEMDESEEYPAEETSNTSPPLPSGRSHDSRPSSPQLETMDQDDYPNERQSSMRQQQQGQQDNWSVPASPTSPMVHGDERMEESNPRDRDQQLYYYRQQQQYQQQYQPRHQKQAASAYYYAAAQASSSPSSSSHGGHGYSQGGHSHHSSKHMISPPSSSSSSSADLHPQAYSYAHSHNHSSSERSGNSRATSMSTIRNTSGMTPPSPQSTPVTPTKYRFDPIQDCLRQERRLREEATL